MQDRWDAGQVGYRTGGIQPQDRWNPGKERCRKGEMQKRTDAERERCRKEGLRR